METKDVITIVALIFGPVAAVTITLWNQKRTERRAAKERLFQVLMAHRRSIPPTFEWANSLNLIDVVYADHNIVVQKWHELYNIVIQNPINWPQWNHAYIELLSEMAIVLGYHRLQQTDIDRFYAPQAHGSQAALNQEIQIEFLRVLKGTQSLQATPLLDGGGSQDTSKK